MSNRYNKRYRTNKKNNIDIHIFESQYEKNLSEEDLEDNKINFTNNTNQMIDELRNLDKLKISLENKRKCIEIEKKKLAEINSQSLENNDKTCKICMDNNSEIAFVPCGHKCACKSCSDLITNCPICRTVISSRLRIFET